MCGVPVCISGICHYLRLCPCFPGLSSPMSECFSLLLAFLSPWFTLSLLWAFCTSFFLPVSYFFVSSSLCPPPLLSSPRLSPAGGLQRVAAIGSFAPRVRPSRSLTPAPGDLVLEVNLMPMDYHLSCCHDHCKECHPCKPQQAWILPEPALLWEHEPLEPRHSLPFKAVPQSAGPEKAAGSLRQRTRAHSQLPTLGK